MILIILTSFTSCKKEVIPSSPPYIDQWWDKYYGTYTVIDTANDFTYEMQISQMERYFDGMIYSDSIQIENLANKFDEKGLYK